MPDLNRIDDVLPEHVAAGSDGGHGTEVHIGHPDAQAGVFLEQGLAGVHLNSRRTVAYPLPFVMEEYKVNVGTRTLLLPFRRTNL